MYCTLQFVVQNNLQSLQTLLEPDTSLVSHSGLNQVGQIILFSR